MQTNRRDFLRIGGGAAICLAGAGSLLQLTGCPTETTDPPDDEGWITVALADHPALADVGGMVVLAVDGTDVTLALVRTGDDAFAALDGICTHQGCELGAYDSGAEELICYCHDSHFDLSGEMVSGPAEAALAVYATEYEPGADEVRVQIGA